MSTKASNLMKSAQIQKSKQSIKKLIEWYAIKEQYFKKYVPIQQIIIKKLLNAAQLSFSRLKDIALIVQQEKQIYVYVFEKGEKNSLSTETKFQPPKQVKSDPKDPKGQSKIVTEGPVWSNNIDRVLIAMCQNQRQRQRKIKKYFKTIDSIHEEIIKQEARYKSEIKKQQKDLDKLFEKMDQKQKDASKNVGKLIKQSKAQNIKDSAFFIGELKKLESDIYGEFQYFYERNKTILKLFTIILKNEKSISKKIKEQLTNFFSFKKENFSKQGSSDEKLWGLIALMEDKVEEERAKYFNATMLKSQRIQMLKQIVDSIQPFKSNYQIIIKFLEMNKTNLMSKIKTEEEFLSIFKTISYRYWPGIYLAQGWLIETYTPSVLYMSYDYNMLIYSNEGTFLKKIHTSSSKVNKIENQTIFLQEITKGFFSDSKQEYKIKFEDYQRMQEFQLFVENQIK